MPVLLTEDKIIKTPVSRTMMMRMQKKEKKSSKKNTVKILTGR